MKNRDIKYHRDGHLSHSGTGVWLDKATHGMMRDSEEITTANSVNEAT